MREGGDGGRNNVDHENVVNNLCGITQPLWAAMIMSHPVLLMVVVVAAEMATTTVWCCAMTFYRATVFSYQATLDGEV